MAEDSVDILFGGAGGGGLGDLFNTVESVTDRVNDALDAAGQVRDTVDAVGDLFNIGDQTAEATRRQPADAPVTVTPPGWNPNVPIQLPPSDTTVPQGDLVRSGGGFVTSAISWILSNPGAAQPLIDFVINRFGGGSGAGGAMGRRGIVNKVDCKNLALLIRDEEPEIWKALVMFASGATMPIRLSEKGKAVYFALQVAASDIDICNI